MNLNDLKQSAAACLARAFNAKDEDSTPAPQVLHAAVSVLCLKDEPPSSTLGTGNA